MIPPRFPRVHKSHAANVPIPGPGMQSSSPACARATDRKLAVIVVVSLNLIFGCIMLLFLPKYAFTKAPYTKLTFLTRGQKNIDFFWRDRGIAVPTTVPASSIISINLPHPRLIPPHLRSKRINSASSTEMEKVVSAPSAPTFREDIPPLILVGHRGAGQNKATIHSDIRENTITSFNQAAKYGAEFCEFDVQVTQDGHPVIFHDDWILTDDGISTKISELSLREFSAIGPQRDGTQGKNLMRKTSDGSIVPWTAKVEDFMPTLAETFAGVVHDIGFNIEVKFFGQRAADVDFTEIDRMLNAILQIVDQLAGDRKIYFSSFHPDAVIQLKRRQSKYPVLFLTDGGGSIHDDPRMNSMEAAVQLCSENKVEGIVSEVNAILRNSSQAAAIKREGLMLLTYGDVNNEADAIYFQQFYGVDGVIVDHVEDMKAAVDFGSKTELSPPFGRFGGK